MLACRYTSVVSIDSQPGAASLVNFQGCGFSAVFPRYYFLSIPAISQHPRHLQVTIDKFYGCAIMVLLSRARLLRALQTMLARHAVLLTASTAEPRLPPTTPLESTLVARGHFVQFWCNVSLFKINTCKTVSKQTTLTTFRMNTYGKQGGGGSPQRINNLFRKRATLNELLCFQTLAHSFPRRPHRKSFFFCAFRTLIIVTEGVAGVLSGITIRCIIPHRE